MEDVAREMGQLSGKLEEDTKVGLGGDGAKATLPWACRGGWGRDRAAPCQAEGMDAMIGVGVGEVAWGRW